MITRKQPLFRLAGIQVYADASWILIALLVTWSLATGVFPQTYRRLPEITYWAMGVLGALGLFLSIIVHELAHSLVARRYGLPIRGITLFLFGGVAEMEDEPPSPRAELLMAAAGPLASLLIGAALFGLHHLLVSAGGPLFVRGITGYLWTINLVLAGFNLLPAFPLDGGRIFRSLLWRWKGSLLVATRVASQVGTAFGFALMAVGVYSIVRGRFVNGLWWILIGSFLRTSSRSSYRSVLITSRLAGVKVRDVMDADAPLVPYQTRIDSFVEDYVQRSRRDFYVVTKQGEPYGVAMPQTVSQMSREQWTNRLVADITDPRIDRLMVGPDVEVLDALKIIRGQGAAGLIVIEDRNILGTICRSDITRRVGPESRSRQSRLSGSSVRN